MPSEKRKPGFSSNADKTLPVATTQHRRLLWNCPSRQTERHLFGSLFPIRAVRRLIQVMNTRRLCRISLRIHSAFPHAPPIYPQHIVSKNPTQHNIQRTQLQSGADKQPFKTPDRPAYRRLSSKHLRQGSNLTGWKPGRISPLKPPGPLHQQTMIMPRLWPGQRRAVLHPFRAGAERVPSIPPPQATAALRTERPQAGLFGCRSKRADSGWYSGSPAGVSPNFDRRRAVTSDIKLSRQNWPRLQKLAAERLQKRFPRRSGPKPLHGGKHKRNWQDGLQNEPPWLQKKSDGLLYG